MAKEKVLLDSDVLIWWLRGHHDITARINQIYQQGTLFSSPVNVAEIEAGRRKGEEEKIQHAFDLTTIIEIDHSIGKLAGEFLVKYQKSHGVHLGDSFLAATVELFDLRFWTLNIKHYPMLKKNRFFAYVFNIP